MKITPLPGCECLSSIKNGLKARYAGIIDRMPSAARLTPSRLPALLLFVGFYGLFTPLFMPCAQSQEPSPTYDPDTDPRIDRRPHPNALPSPNSSTPNSFLNLGNKAPELTEPDNPVFLAFAAWIQKYRLASDEQKTQLAVEGVTLAKTRRAALAELIKSNPQRAIAWAVSHENRSILPVQVQEQLEKRVAGCAEYNVVYVYTPRPGDTNSDKLLNNPQNNTPKSQAPEKNPKQGTGNNSGVTYRRYAVMNGKIFQAYVYGWRGRLTTKYNIPLHGVALDNLLAVDSNPARILEKGEKIPENAKIGNPDKKCPFCATDIQANVQATGQVEVITQVGNTYYFFDNQEHLQQLMDKFAKLQLIIGPKTGSVCDEPLTDLMKQIPQDDISNTGIRNNGAPAGAF